MKALQRFIARRGRLSVMCSDRGTDVVGLDGSLNTFDWKLISEYSTAKKVKF